MTAVATCPHTQATVISSVGHGMTSDTVTLDYRCPCGELWSEEVTLAELQAMEMDDVEMLNAMPPIEAEIDAYQAYVAEHITGTQAKPNYHEWIAQYRRAQA